MPPQEESPLPGSVAVSREPASDVRDERGPGRPLRILQMGSTSWRGGVAQAIFTLTLSLKKLGHDVMLVTDGGDLESLRQAGVRCELTELHQRPRCILRGTRDVRRALRSFRPDVVHAHGRSSSLRSYLAGRAPDWFTLHNTHLTERVGLLDTGLFRRLLSPLGKRVFVLDEKARDYLRTQLGVSPTRVDLAGNGIDTDRFRVPSPEERKQAREQFGVKDGKTLALFVGRLHPSKQPIAVVHAAKAARDAGLDQVQFVLVGDGDLRPAVTEAIAQAGVADLCSLHGWMDPLKAYFAADLLLMPSQYEGFGLVAAEAMATGCPVLRTRTGGADQQIVEGKTGFLCGTDVPDFVAALLKILKNREQLAAMRAPSREWGVSRLGASAQARSIVSLYRKHLRRS